MPANRVEIQVGVSGMVCPSCKERIEKRLGSEAGIFRAQASYKKNRLDLAYDPAAISLEKVGAILGEMEYRITQTISGNSLNWRSPLEAVGLLIGILGLYIVGERLGIFEWLNIFPEAEAGMGYGMVFGVGLLTSAHCLAMCGGINISQAGLGEGSRKGTAPSPFLSPLLYGVGRVTSYTIIGTLAGGLGSMISFSGNLRGAIEVLAGFFMVLMGLNMAGNFPWLRRLIPALPKIFSSNSSGQVNRRPFYVGLINGLMPCGPLQAMQLYALSTSSPLQGGLSMFLFALGTLPLTMGLGMTASLLGRRFLNKAVRVGAILVFLMGLGMLANGLRLVGFTTPGFSSVGEASEAVMREGWQQVDTDLSPTRYPAIRVRPGVPVRWNLRATPESLNGCNNRVFLPAFSIEKKLSPGDNLIEFTPEEAGVYPYTCWMGMIASRIVVGDVSDDGTVPDFDLENLPINQSNGGMDEIPW
ncbi:MAG: sulfite exporter TauE/SafE family protein [Planctomycetota bacterium]|jgi:sulfite exporter TauE/SafE/copper chaperone CopZ|nr:sulfite exporter TauE/SafE family protein [Planctomycetota bacterium]